MPAEPADSAAELQSAVENSLARYAIPGQRLCLALSGGRDSVVLLHVLHKFAPAYPLRTLHIDHGLHPASAEWANTCSAICGSLGVPFVARKVMVERDAGRGLEAAARDARYAALAEQLMPDELLVTAHHRNDQVETLLLQLLRGAGVHGIAAMPVFGLRHQLPILRPLLTVSTKVIRAFAEAQQINWIEDPSNNNLSLDRNYLRHEIIPRLEERWQAAQRSVARTAGLAGEAAEILDELADNDLWLLQSGNRLDMAGLSSLSQSRQRNVVRRLLRQLGLPVPGERQLTLLLATMHAAHEDAQPLIAWPGVRVHRYQNTIWFFSEAHDPARWPADPECYSWNPQVPLDMGPVRGSLTLEACRSAGIAAEWGNAELVVRFRQGGESLRPAVGAATRALKNLLQESHIVPWMRSHIPMLYHGEQLLAVGDLWISAACATRPGEAGLRIVWSAHADIR
jgi:tRNA(Ile)-lysidine synthase